MGCVQTPVDSSRLYVDDKVSFDNQFSAPVSLPLFLSFSCRSVANPLQSTRSFIYTLLESVMSFY